MHIKPCTEWTRQDWNDAYNAFCQMNPKNPPTKKQYYDMVLNSHKMLAGNQDESLKELSDKWIKGWRNAVSYAKERGCDFNGRLLSDVYAERKQADALETAQKALDISFDVLQNLEEINREKKCQRK